MRRLLYPLFWLLLLIPLVRRWRRRDWWPAFRMAAIATCALVAASAAAGLPAWAATSSGLLGVVLLLLPPAVDPDRERKIQRLHQADYFLNGGLHNGEGVYLFIRGDRLLMASQSRPEAILSELPISSIERILVDGEPYVPVYVSEAKDPPRRELEVDQDATARLELVAVETLTFTYSGAFSRHLADTAAHAIFSVRDQVSKPAPADELTVIQ